MKKDALKSCPKTDDFIAAFLSEPDEPRTKNLLDHSKTCSLCQRKFLLLGQLQKEIQARGKDIEEVDLSRKERNQLKRMARLKLRELNVHQAHPFLPPSARQAIFLGTGLAFLVLAAFFLARNHRPTPRWREAPGQELRLLQPYGSLQEAPSIFSWTEVKGREEFIFRLQDEELKLLYKARTFLPRIQIPEPVRMNLTKGKSYVWTVEALDKDAHVLAEEYLTFRLEE